MRMIASAWIVLALGCDGAQEAVEETVDAASVADGGDGAGPVDLGRAGEPDGAAGAGGGRGSGRGGRWGGRW